MRYIAACLGTSFSVWRCRRLWLKIWISRPNASLSPTDRLQMLPIWQPMTFWHPQHLSVGSAPSLYHSICLSQIVLNQANRNRNWRKGGVRRQTLPKYALKDNDVRWWTRLHWMRRPLGHRAVAINVIRLGNLVDDHWTLVLLWRENNPQDFARSI